MCFDTEYFPFKDFPPIHSFIHAFVVSCAPITCTLNRAILSAIQTAGFAYSMSGFVGLIGATLPKEKGKGIRTHIQESRQTDMDGEGNDVPLLY